MVHTLAGIGSLVSEASAVRSFAFSNFRIGEVHGWRRAFNQANWVNVEQGWGSIAKCNTAALAMVKADASFVSRVALLDVEDSDLFGFYERETGYNVQSTPFYERASDGSVVQMGLALLCTACTDDREADALWAPGGAMEQNCAGSAYAQSWLRDSLRPLWPPPTDVLLPAPGYLRLCAAAHLRAGMLDHFLDSTLLNDRTTTLREHCAQNDEARLVIETLGAASSAEAPVRSVHGEARKKTEGSAQSCCC